MKFAKKLVQTFEDENIPHEWRKVAIHYKALKKKISKVVKELQECGLEKDTLQKLLQVKNFTDDSTNNYNSLNQIEKINSFLSQDPEPIVAYSFEGGFHKFEPAITITLDKDSIPTFANLPSTTRAKLNRFFYSNALITGTLNENSYTNSEIQKNHSTIVSSPHENNIVACDNLSKEKIQHFPRFIYMKGKSKMVIQLRSDSEFFHMLISELKDLEDFNSSIERTFESHVISLANKIASVASPTAHNSDLYTWRTIFQLYMNAEVFFSDIEIMKGAKTSEEAKQRLYWYKDKLEKSRVISRFRNNKCIESFIEFWNLNSRLVKSYRFQELNYMAMTKILKKFDKHTALTSRKSFPQFIAADNSAFQSLSKSMCFIIFERLLCIVPQLDDYLCPICSSIAFKPIRLSCSHVFCIRCLVKLQRKNEDRCPLCRMENVLDADETNLDMAHLKYLKQWFPRETKLKQKENEYEIFKEQFFYSEASIRCVIY